MSELTKILLIGSVVFSALGYNLYTNAENRKLYAECLRVVEKLATDGPNRIGLPFCSR